MRKECFGAGLALAASTGCYARFDLPATKAAYAAAGGDQSYQECAARVLKAQASFNSHASSWSRAVVAGIVLGGAISVVAIVTGRDTPGEGASDPVAKERAFSKLEVTTGALAVLAGGDALYAWYSTAEMSVSARKIADNLARCPPRPPAVLAPPAAAPPASPAPAAPPQPTS